MTLREHLEEIRDRHESDHASATGILLYDYCRYCENLHPCPDFTDAVAALEILDAAEGVYQDASQTRGPGPGLLHPSHRLVPDPEPSS